jgi:hypothetical protein
MFESSVDEADERDNLLDLAIFESSMGEADERSEKTH